MTNFKHFTVFVVLSTTFSSFAQMPEWSYDAGPDATTKMGRELIDITASIPNMPEISKQIMGRQQKFRPAFGPIPWRMRQEENKVKILFMGQDGTHIAEAAGRPATAGFGGRAQDFANYFGVNEGAAFMNAYSFTIKGQYGVYGSPYIFKKDGEASVRTANVVSNQLWLMSNDLSSPIVTWRNNLIDWIIRNNKDSMKLIVLFGGAARDAIATYAQSKGAEVYGREEKNMKYIQVPETAEEYAGGNNTFPSILSQEGKDLYSEILGKKLVYKNSKDQKLALNSLKENLSEYLQKAVFTKGGKYKNGLINAAQIGGYDLDTMKVNGVVTRSLKGLTLNDGTKIKNDIIVVSLPHPSYLSRVVMDADSYEQGKRDASAQVMKNVAELDKFKANGWKIDADINKTNFYDKGSDYVYGRSDIGPEFYDFGTPQNRMVSKSTAKRMSGAANTVIIGTRDNGNFSRSEIKKMTEAKAAEGINGANLFLARPSTVEERYTFDPGPGAKLAKIMIQNIDEEKIFEEKKGMSFDEDGIDAYNVKTHPSVSYFGHYRGTFTNAKVVVLADPIGYDDLVTARALTGERGQYIHGLMQDTGINDNYLVIKTVPFGMDGATEDEWKVVLKQTTKYRDEIMKAVLADNSPAFVLTDGENAAAEARRILKGTDIKIIDIRGDRKGNTGIVDAGTAALNLLKLDHAVSGRIANIPRSHLSFYSRIWEGTSGDRVITSEGKEYKGLAFAEVVPAWAYEQELKASKAEKAEVENMIEVLEDANLPLPGESIPRYLRRVDIDPSLSFINILKNMFKAVA